MEATAPEATAQAAVTDVPEGAAVAAVAVVAAVIDRDAAHNTLKALGHITVQWHITDRCNLRCTHCYQDEYRHEGFAFSELRRIANEVFDWQEREQRRAGRPVPLFINLTGGEPCLHPDFTELLRFLSSRTPKQRLGILSNGTLLDAAQAQLFAEVGIAFVQLSVEGTEKTHEAVRGKGSFDKTLAAGRLLQKAGVRTVWSFTAHADNHRELSDVVALARKQGIDRVWTDRMIPVCRADAPTPLNAAQTHEYLLTLGTLKKPGGLGITGRLGRLQRVCATIFGKRRGTELFTGRGLQFLAGGGVPYRCKAGRELIAIMPDGAVYPCRRLPQSVGNILQTPLTELYENEVLRRLRSFEAPDECARCNFAASCKGGLRCLAYAVTGDMFRRDPGCRALEREGMR